MEKRSSFCAACTIVFKESQVYPIKNQRRSGGAQKEHRKRFLMFDPVTFNIFSLHLAGIRNQLLQGIRKTFIKMSEEMKYFMNDTFKS